MDISALSSAMAMQSLQNAISTTMLAKTMNQDAMSADCVIQSIEKANPTQKMPVSNHILDVRA